MDRPATPMGPPQLRQCQTYQSAPRPHLDTRTVILKKSENLNKIIAEWRKDLEIVNKVHDFSFQDEKHIKAHLLYDGHLTYTRFRF